MPEVKETFRKLVPEAQQFPVIEIPFDHHDNE